MSANRIFAIQQRQKELENELLRLAKGSSFDQSDLKKIESIRGELANLQKQQDQILYENQNWNCSHHYKSVNGKVEEVYEINHKPVTKKEYFQFIKKNSDKMPTKFIPVMDKDDLELWLKPLLIY